MPATITIEAPHNPRIYAILSEVSEGTKIAFWRGTPIPAAGKRTQGEQKIFLGATISDLPFHLIRDRVHTILEGAN